jgi:ferredoxin
MSAPQAPHRLNFPELDREIEVQGEETIFHGARRNGLRIVGACGGRGTCGTCVVRVVEGRIDHIHSAAPDLLETDDDAAGADSPAPGRRKWLRACQLRVRSDCTIEVAPRSLAPVVRADVDLGDAGETLPLDPAVSNHDLLLPVATLDDNRSDADPCFRDAGHARPAHRHRRRAHAFRRIAQRRHCKLGAAGATPRP